LPVIRSVEGLGADDVLVITDGRAPQQAYDRLVAAVGHERVLAPPFLRISPSQRAET